MQSRVALYMEGANRAFVFQDFPPVLAIFNQGLEMFKPRPTDNTSWLKTYGKML